MRALVVYESMFGNTQQVAGAVARGIATGLEVDLVSIGDAPSRISDAVGLLVIGGPTHAFGMSRPQTRASAGEQGALVAAADGPGIREWIEALTAPAGRVAAATFDTRIDKRYVPGSAARAAARRLRRLGFAVADDVMSFFVSDVAGPLEEGEIVRAEAWGEHLGATYAPRTRGPAAA